ncbi:helix-turn-helix transcriptional regulator [Desulfosporosinus sp. PR]|uniref:helix-turn-helix domain-containing protein n=1 Tax=Candidatus Desulfosporosinus nitrosoreducens TaxID=3401928 RepID=UPI0027F57529|nr:helix-turn-helix transcriptional regulator [Desulfosporosinus sp. PR]MDQ7095985.1 helix-turn-helix transcriptional regulator [Desulfosporosinus sp. PR]
MDKPKIPKRIQDYIKSKGLKQGFIAQQAGYKKNEFSAMMNGYKKITVEDMERICLALEVSPSLFIKPESLKVG